MYWVYVTVERFKFRRLGAWGALLVRDILVGPAVRNTGTKANGRMFLVILMHL
jgi:hypothetical protein